MLNFGTAPKGTNFSRVLYGVPSLAYAIFERRGSCKTFWYLLNQSNTCIFILNFDEVGLIFSTNKN